MDTINNDMGDIGYGDGTKVFSIDGLNERFYDSVSIQRKKSHGNLWGKPFENR